MRTVFIALLFILSASKCWSQEQGDPILASVRYLFIHKYDRSQPDSSLQKEMILQLAKSGSRYAIYVVKRPEPPASTAAPVTTIAVVGKPLAVVRNPALPNGEIFQYPAAGKLVTNSTIGRYDYQVEQKMPVINWQLEKDKRKIGGYNCQKATGEFAGRKYIAWFTTELPFKSGPWKLSGLPGLILEAKDETETVQFLFKEISKDENTEMLKSDMRKLIPVSMEDYLRAKKAFEQDPVLTMQSQLPAGAPPVSLGYMDATGRMTTGENAERARKAKDPANFNPIELN